MECPNSSPFSASFTAYSHPHIVDNHLSSMHVICVDADTDAGTDDGDDDDDDGDDDVEEKDKINIKIKN